MRNEDCLRIDAESVAVDMKQLKNLLNIVIDDIEDNGELEGRRALTISALHIIYDHLGLLADMQMDVVGRLSGPKGEVKEA